MVLKSDVAVIIKKLFFITYNKYTGNKYPINETPSSKISILPL
jgi:hypothetical protein